MKLNLACGPDKREGFVNRDPRIDGWKFQDGLRDYADGSVDGITIGCALYLIDPDEQVTFLAEAARVLRPGGVIRITEPDVHGNIVTGLREAGLDWYDMTPGVTYFDDSSLENGRTERIFILEGVK